MGRQFDKQTMFDDELTMASGFTVGTKVGTTVVNLGASNLNQYNPPKVRVAIRDADSAADGALIQINIQHSADGSTGWTDLVTGEVSTANAASFKDYVLPIPPVHQPYLRARYVTSVEAFTAGKMSCGIV